MVGNMKYKVYDAMTMSPIVISKEENVQTAAKTMSDNKVASLVVKESGNFIGLITEKDIARKLAAQNLIASETKVADIMSVDVKTTSSTTDLVHVIEVMNKIGQRQFPVIDNNKFVGLLTLNDVLRIQPQLFGLVYENISLREEERKPLYKSKNSNGACESCGNYSFNLEELEGQFLCSECRLI